MIFHIIETLAASPIWLGLMGGGLIIPPVMGIMLIHRTK